MNSCTLIKGVRFYKPVPKQFGHFGWLACGILSAFLAYPEAVLAVDPEFIPKPGSESQIPIHFPREVVKGKSVEPFDWRRYAEISMEFMSRELDARHNGTGIGERAFGASPGVLAAKPSNNSDDCPRSGNPVVLSSGEKYLSQQDFSASGLYGLSLQRTYRSVKGSGWMFGPRWLSGLEIRPLRITKTGCTIDPDWGCIPVSATVVDIDGVERVYRLNDSAFALSARTQNEAFLRRVDAVARGDGDEQVDAEIRLEDGVDDRALARSPTTFVYSDDRPQPLGSLTHRYRGNWNLQEKGRTYVYSDAGYIQRVYDERGALLQSFIYDAAVPYRVLKISTTTGQSVSLTWQDDHVTQIVDSFSGIWRYEYKPNGMLWKVWAPSVGGAASDVREYFYESSVDAQLLTGVSFNGRRYSSYDYYSDRRVKESSLAGGEVRDRFSYASNQTTVLDAQGQTTTYAFASVAGNTKLILIRNLPQLDS